MKVDDLLNHISRQDVLRAFGLGPRVRDYIWPALGLFSTGVLIGAGVALMFTPKSGSELREDVADQLRSKLEEMGSRIERMASREFTGEQGQQGREQQGQQGQQGQGQQGQYTEGEFTEGQYTEGEYNQGRYGEGESQYGREGGGAAA